MYGQQVATIWLQVGKLMKEPNFNALSVAAFKFELQAIKIVKWPTKVAQWINDGKRSRKYFIKR